MAHVSPKIRDVFPELRCGFFPRFQVSSSSPPMLYSGDPRRCLRCFLFPIPKTLRVTAGSGVARGVELSVLVIDVEHDGCRDRRGA